MRHATDGELHAFLDGGLDLLPEGRGDEVRDHLASCAACRERLQDEEETRARASHLLGEPSLEGLELPSFEELRERAEASSPGPPGGSTSEPEGLRHRGPLKGLPMAWAATIILAVGVGWMGGQVWRGIPAARGPSSEREIQLPPEVALPSPSEATPTRQGGIEAASTDAQEATAPSPAAEPNDPPVQPKTEASELEAPASASLRSMALEERKSSDRAETGGVPLSDLQILASRRAEGDAPAPDLEMEDTASPSDSAETTLAVPGLKVVSIGWEEKVPGGNALLIRQLLMPGDTLELRYLGMLLGTEAEAGARPPTLGGLDDTRTDWAYAGILEASLPPGWNQVVMERGRVLLVARAPLSKDNLKALLKTIH